MVNNLIIVQPKEVEANRSLNRGNIRRYEKGSKGTVRAFGYAFFTGRLKHVTRTHGEGR